MSRGDDRDERREAGNQIMDNVSPAPESVDEFGDFALGSEH